MKKLTLLIFIVAFACFPDSIGAQSSSTVRTKVGNPPVIAASCPIPNAKATCGSEGVPVNGCGHCSSSYIGIDPFLKVLCSMPTYPGIHYALDISASPLDLIYMPEVNGKKIKWTFARQSVDSDGITAIQYYAGTDESNGNQYWIQFHHTKPGSARPVAYSGEQGAQVCQSGCKTGTGPHLHLEFAEVSETGQLQWVEAPNYFCKNS